MAEDSSGAWRVRERGRSCGELAPFGVRVAIVEPGIRRSRRSSPRTPTAPTRVRYAVSRGARERIAGRARMSDEEWAALGALEDDAAYYDAFAKHFGVRIRP